MSLVGILIMISLGGNSESNFLKIIKIVRVEEIERCYKKGTS